MPIPARCWYLFDRDLAIFDQYRWVGRGPIFTHQYAQAWLDLRGLRDGPPFGMNYFQNSAVATYAHRAFCLSLRGMYPDYSEDLWGVTPSDSEIGYIIWGDAGTRRDIDGTVVPCAAGGSLMFTPEICLPALHYMHNEFGDYVYGKYGFADSFHPQTLWVNPDIVGIDQAIILISAENLRSQRVWNWFMRNTQVNRAVTAIFEPDIG